MGTRSSIRGHAWAILGAPVIYYLFSCGLGKSCGDFRVPDNTSLSLDCRALCDILASTGDEATQIAHTDVQRVPHGARIWKWQRQGSTHIPWEGVCQ